MKKPSKELRALIEKAGELQRQQHQAQKRYESIRAQLMPLLKAEVGGDVWAASRHFKAALMFEERTHIDPLVFLERVSSDELRKDLLKVGISAARKRLTPRTFKKVSEIITADEPTLRITARNSNGKGEGEVR